MIFDHGIGCCNFFEALYAQAYLIRTDFVRASIAMVDTGIQSDLRLQTKEIVSTRKANRRRKHAKGGFGEKY